MTMPTSSAMASGQTSLPPLHQVAYSYPYPLGAGYAHGGDKAIPEFHSHTPQERQSSSVPRKLVHERGSPSYGHSGRTSPSSSGTVPENVSYTSPAESAAPHYDPQLFMFPGPPPVDQRRMSVMSTGSSTYAPDVRGSPHLPPVSSMASSRGSSFDMESGERTPSVSLPSLFSNQPSSVYGHYPPDPRGQQMPPQDYGHHRYSMSSVSSEMSPSSYRPVSPTMQHYAQPQYYAHSHSGVYAQPQPHNAGYLGSRQSVMVDSRSPFSTTAPPADLSMGSFDQAPPGKRRRGNLPKQVTDLLRNWLNDHVQHPYPTEDEKQMLMAQTGLTINQISNWFINARRRRLPNMTNAGGDSKGQRQNPPR